MKIASSGITIETNASFEEHEFSIGDPAMIMEHLRKTIYSDPIRAICQEVMSNARDAHRENGNDDVPIKVKLPNPFRKTWECQDFGPGISPQRMIDVFIKFGNSTKRGSGEFATDDGEKQTGGFGVGAKTPWSYTDSFNILTRAMEGDQLVERTYIALIAEDRKNKLMELEGSFRIIDPNDESIPKEERCTGTTIIVDVKKDDFNNFNRHTVNTARFWDVRPELSGCDPLPEWQSTEMVVSGFNWGLLKDGRYDGYSYAIVDGIPYRINTYSVTDVYNLRKIMQAGVVIKFPVNYLSIPLSRESLHYDDTTKERICNACTDIINELTNKVEDAINNSANLHEAYIKFYDFRNAFGGADLIKECSWTSPDGEVIKLCSTGLHIKHVLDVKQVKRQDNFIKSKTLSYSVGLEKDIRFVVNDDGTKIFSRLKAETLFDELGNDIKLIVVKQTPETLDILNDEWHIKHLNPIYTSTVKKKKKSRPTTSSGGKRNNCTRACYEYVDHGRYSRRQRQCWKTKTLDIVNGSGVYVTLSNKDIMDKGVYNSNISAALGLVSTVYGIPERFVGKLGPGWVPFMTAIKNIYDSKVVDNEQQKNLALIKYANGSKLSEVFYYNSIIPTIVRSRINDLNPDSFLVRWAKKSGEIEALSSITVDNTIETLTNILGFHATEDEKATIDDEDLIKLFNDPKTTVYKLYPLLKTLSNSHSDEKEVVDDIVSYINSKGV